MKRGEVYFVAHRQTVGSEMAKGRPAIIVSNNILNATSSVVEVVFLTTKPKKEMPTHVIINATGVPSIACCEQISTVSMLLIGSYCGRCTEEEMHDIDCALMKSLGLFAIPVETIELHAEKRADDPVDHPSHYTDGKIEVIDFIEDKKLGYHLGNAVKYISRAGKKDPSKKEEDLRKAIWYINREIEKVTKEELV